MYFDRFDIISAHYLFYTLYHEGQWSDKYKRLCKLSRYYTPSPCDGGFDSLSENGKDIFMMLVEREESKCKS